MEKSQFAKPSGPDCVTSGQPGADKVPIGRTLEALTATVLKGIDEATEDALSFCHKHERFANAKRLARVSSPHALKAWAAERLPSLGISYGFSNRLSHDFMEAHFDEQASLRVVAFADDLTMITRFCRKVEHLSIDVNAHTQGLEFRFRFSGAGLGAPFDEVECQGLDALMRSTARDNCLRNRIMAAESAVEAQSIVLRKRIRLGLSPRL